MKSIFFNLLILIAGAACGYLLVGCMSPSSDKTGVQVVDINKTADNIDLVIDAAEVYGALFLKGKNYDNFIANAEKIRQVNDLPAARNLLKQLQAGIAPVGPTTQAAK